MAFRYRMSPTATQEQAMAVHCGQARFIWNLALEQGHVARQSFGVFSDQREWDSQLAEARGACDWLAAGSSSVQQAALRDLRQSYANWWKNPGHFRAPNWRKRSQRQGFVIRDVTVRKLNRKWAEVTVPKCGRVKFRLSRSLGDHGSARVTLDRSGRWHVSFVAPQPEVKKAQTGSVIGLDMGVANSVTTSNSEHLDMGELLTAGERRRLVGLQRKLPRQAKGSNRRKATKLSIARLKAREADRRKDWREKTTTSLVRNHDLIAIEDLKVSNMMRSASGTLALPGVNVAQKRGLNRSIASQGWAEFRLRLEQKADAASTPTIVVAVNPANTSRMCSKCHHTTKKNRKNQAAFSCVKCGHTAHADVNASLNILNRGQQKLAAGHAVNGHGGQGATRPPCEVSTTKAA